MSLSCPFGRPCLTYYKLILQIKFNERGAKPHKIRGKEPGSSRQIFYLATGNNEMYKRRRMPDPLDVQQMKVRVQCRFAFLLGI